MNINKLSVFSNLINQDYFSGTGFSSIGSKVYQAVGHVLGYLRSFVIQQSASNEVDQRPEERFLLQYLTPEEKEVVLMAQNSPPEIDQIAEWIRLGQWEQLFAHYPTDSRELSYLLIAAYRLQRIDLDDLATAMLFHRAFCNTERAHLRIVPITSETLDEMLHLSRVEKAQILSAAARVKPNQRTLVLVAQDAIDPYTRNLIVKSFAGRPPRTENSWFFPI